MTSSILFAVDRADTTNSISQAGIQRLQKGSCHFPSSFSSALASRLVAVSHCSHPDYYCLLACFPFWLSGKGSTPQAQHGASGIISFYIFMYFLMCLLQEELGKVDTLDFISCSIGNPVFAILFPREFKGRSGNWVLR